MVKLHHLSIILFWIIILYGACVHADLKTEGRKLMGNQLSMQLEEFRCVSDPGMIMNCLEDGECEQPGFRICMKGYCCMIIADATPPHVFLPIRILSSSSNNKLLVEIEEGSRQYPLMLPPPLSLPTTTPRRLGDNDKEWYRWFKWGMDDDIDKSDDKGFSGGVQYDNEVDVDISSESNNLNSQITTSDVQLEKQDDQSSDTVDGQYNSFDDGVGRFIDGGTTKVDAEDRSNESNKVDAKDGPSGLQYDNEVDADEDVRNNLNSQIMTSEVQDDQSEDVIDGPDNSFDDGKSRSVGGGTLNDNKHDFKEVTERNNLNVEENMNRNRLKRPSKTQDNQSGGSDTEKDAVTGWVNVYPWKKGFKKRDGTRRPKKVARKKRSTDDTTLTDEDRGWIHEDPSKFIIHE